MLLAVLGLGARGGGVRVPKVSFTTPPGAFPGGIRHIFGSDTVAMGAVPVGSLRSGAPSARRGRPCHERLNPHSDHERALAVSTAYLAAVFLAGAAPVDDGELSVLHQTAAGSATTTGSRVAGIFVLLPTLVGFRG